MSPPVDRSRRRGDPHRPAHEGLSGRHPRGRPSRPLGAAAARSSACSARTARARRRPSGMLTTRVIPTSGRRVRRRHRRRRAPGRRQAGASASCRRPTRSTARSTSSENLYFHGRYFGMSAEDRDEPQADELLEQFRLADRAKAPRARAVGRHGAAAHGRPGDHARPRRCCSSTSRPPASTRRAASRCGTIIGELHARRARRSCSRRTTWKRPTSSATALAIIDHGRLLALDTPARAQAVGRRRHDRHASRPTATSTRSRTLLDDGSTASTRADRVDGTVRLHVTGARRRAARGRHAAERRRLHGQRRLDGRADARDRLHQPHRKGPARMTTTDA